MTDQNMSNGLAVGGLLEALKKVDDEEKLSNFSPSEIKMAQDVVWKNNIILPILDDLYAQVEYEFQRQDNRAERRLQQNRDCSAADGQAYGLEKAMKIIDAKRQEIKEGLKNEEVS